MHRDHQPEFDNLADRFVAVARGRPVIFVLNPGNWGDALIREGAERFLRHYEIDYVSVRLKDLERKHIELNALKRQIGHDDPVMVFNGNGAFTDLYSTGDRVRRLASEFTSVFLLPCTVDMDLRLDRFPADTHIVVRDKHESSAAIPSALFCHDMAFFLDLFGLPPSQSTGFFFRTDKEAPKFPMQMPLDAKNRDLSKFGKTQDPIDGFVSAVADSAEVHTNRLHVGIAAALLGRETYLSDNNYFKIRAIFHSSIEGTFPNVRFNAPTDFKNM